MVPLRTSNEQKGEYQERGIRSSIIRELSFWSLQRKISVARRKSSEERSLLFSILSYSYSRFTKYLLSISMWGRKKRSNATIT